MTLDLDAINAEFAEWPIYDEEGRIVPTERPQLTREQFDAALEQWVATLPPNATQIAPPLWAIYGPAPDVIPMPDPEPEAPCEPQPQWFFAYGRRTSDSRAYLGIGVIELDGSEREERYHPATNTRLHALLERYLTETDE
jgi:hypothetical protein